jgi:circadian clock protein KaiB
MKPVLPNEGSSTDADDGETISLRLYIAGGTLASTRARENLHALCEKQGAGRFHIDVVDILREPLRAISEGVLVTPTLVRLSPLPLVKIVGDLSDMGTVLSALGLVDAKPK